MTRTWHHDSRSIRIAGAPLRRRLVMAAGMLWQGALAVPALSVPALVVPAVVIPAVVGPGPLAAQATGAPPVGGRPRMPGQPGRRAQLEQALQARTEQILRRRLAPLSDDQFRQLRQLSMRVENERRQLRRDEMDTRAQLRRELGVQEGVNETRIGELLDQLPKLERRRIDMMEQEQRDLAKFLTPSQRARYFALQDELRRIFQDTQRRRMGDGPPGDLDSAAAGGRGRRPPALRVPPPGR